MSGFFGFDTSLPGKSSGGGSGGTGGTGGSGLTGGTGGFSGFAPGTSGGEDAFGNAVSSQAALGRGGGGAGEVEDLAVYQWGDDAALLDGGDDLNDETFGVDMGDIGTDFQFFAPPAATAPAKSTGGKSAGGLGTSKNGDAPLKIASTQSRFGRKMVADPFAASEDDFYSSRPSTKKTSAKPAGKKQAEPLPLWAQPEASTAWGSAPTNSAPKQSVPLSAPQARAPAPAHILSLDEIEAQMSQTAVSDKTVPAAPQAHVPASTKQQPRVLTLEEIEQQMISASSSTATATPTPPSLPSQQPPIIPAHASHVQPPYDSIPPPQQDPASLPLDKSGYASQQALLDSMFPELGKAPTPTAKAPSPYGPGGPVALGPARQDSMAAPPGPPPEELARMEALHQRISAKIEAMSKYNNLMGNSDKDFITRIQLSQLATADPYSSDFYAQVYSALARSRQLAAGPPETKQVNTVVQVGAGMGFGVGGPVGNRFGRMGTQTMQRLSTQVKKLVAMRDKRQNDASAALKGALGQRVNRAGVAGPRTVLSLPTGGKPENRPAVQLDLNTSTGPQRPALTRKQVMYALEELYDAVLDLEQLRREAPNPADTARMESWNAAVAAQVESIWRKLMVREPLGISVPHPFISLLNPIKGQKLFPRLLRHLNQQQSLALLTLIIATYQQLDVVARAPPPPVADASLLTKADRMDRAQREAETDNFLHCVIPGVDALINSCSLGFVAGLLGLCSQMMEVWKIASTRPGVALFTALCSKAQSVIRAPADLNNPGQPAADPAEIDQWNKQFAYFLQTILPHLSDLFPSSQAQKAAFGPGAYLLGADSASAAQFNEREGLELERREAEVWGFATVLAVNAPEEEQASLVAALRDKILHSVQAARDPATPKIRAEMKLRNVNMFLHGLGLDASMIE